MRWLIALLILLFAGPFFVLVSGRANLTGNWQTANRASANIAPKPEKHSAALVQVYAARSFSWRGIFSVHMWLATKAKNAKQYTVYQVVGWRLFRKLPVVVKQKDVPDRLWFNNRPKIIAQLSGAAAEKAIPQINHAADRYPYQWKYVLWPGPNSNTFVAYIGRNVPALQLVMPTNAVGKDYLTHGDFLATPPSGKGWQVSLYGVLSFMWSKAEGIQLNILGLVYGVNPWHFAVFLPGVGRVF